jgi:hypothetical protein
MGELSHFERTGHSEFYLTGSLHCVRCVSGTQPPALSKTKYCEAALKSWRWRMFLMGIFATAMLLSI